MKIGGKVSLFAGFPDALTVCPLCQHSARTATLPPARFFLPLELFALSRRLKTEVMMMKTLCIFLLTILLALPAMAETAEPLAQYALSDGQSVEMDLDGDGDLETLTFRVAGSDMDGDEHAEIAVEDDGETTGWNSEVLFYPSAYAADIDGDGIVEIFVCGDWASADYATYCLHWDGGTFTQLPFANASRSGDGGDYLYYGYGYVQAIENGLLTLCGSQDVLGTYFGTRVFALQNGTFEFADDGLWRFPLDEYSWDRALVPTQDIAATFVEGGAETEGVIPAGEPFVITASDKTSVVWFQTEDGREGYLAIAPDEARGWGSTVGGVSEEELFEMVPYAD